MQETTLILTLIIGAVPAASSVAADPLPSWNDGPAKRAVIAFVERVTAEGGPDFVRPSERIAVVDNDGTLWSEQPYYAQGAFAFDRIRALARAHPEWKERQPFKGVIDGDLRAALSGGEKAVAELVAASHSGLTTEEFEAAVKGWLRTARHPRFKRPYTELVYQPMLEVLAYLRANGFKTYIVSGGGVAFVRPWAEAVYGIPPEQVIGSTGKTRFEVRGGKPVLVKLPEIDLIDDGPGKPVGIDRLIGRRPVMAFGNSDGDLQMLQWTTAGAGPRFGLIVHHTDADREWAYDRHSHVGRLDRALDLAPANGWTVVDMKNDWKVVYPAAGRETKSAAGAQAGTPFTTAELAGRTAYRRAVEAVIWGMPAVNFDLLYRSMVRAGGRYNQVVYWSRLPSWKNQTLTPNPDTIYVFPFFSTKDVGPIVLEIPPADGGSITGSIMDAWQCALEDVGPAGADRGRGGRYLILPPGYKDRVPDGYIALPCDTHQGYAVLRSNLKDGSDAGIAEAVAYGRRVRLYPLARASDPPPTAFVDAIETVYDNTIPYDLRYFEALDRFVQAEPWLVRDKAMIDVLKSIGIERGKPFAPDPKTRRILEEAAREAHAWLDARYEAVFSPPFNEGSRWALPASPEVVEGMPTFFAGPDSYPTDGRGVTYSMAYFSAKHLGAGQFYLMTIKDSEGRAFDGGKSYRLTVPANVPVRLYWSVTIYDRATHAFIRGASRFSRSSQSPGLRRNADGSVDIDFGPRPPEAGDANGIPTNPGGQFEVLFRFYGPEKALFDREWKLPDIAERPAGDAVPVTAENFIRAESDLYFANVVKDGGFGTFFHIREPTPIDHQTVIRMNRDTLYSAAVFDLDAGPVTITMPDAGRRFLSMQVIDEDHYVPAVYYGAGAYTLDRSKIGTRYILTGIRALVDPADPEDLGRVHALQDAIKVEQKGAGRFEVPRWDLAGQKKVRDALLVLGATLPDSRRMFGARGEVEPVRHLVGSAMAWGGNPEKDAIYLNVTPARNDGKTAYRLTVRDVPVDGFWSISVYNAEGYFQPDRGNAYSLNSLTAKRAGDGSITVQFGDCDGKTPNCLPITPGWNYLVRLYRPRKEILDGTWKFPEARAVR